MTLRVLVVIVAMVLGGLGAWTKVILHDIDIRGVAVLESVGLESSSDEQFWRNFFDTVLGGIPKIWIAIAASCLASLTGVFVLLSTIFDSMRAPAKFLIPVETLTMCAMFTTFGAVLSFVFSLSTFFTNRLNAASSSDLAMFTTIIPLSKAYIVTAGAAASLIMTTFIISIVDACNRARVKASCSFEPSASALGMDYGQSAITPMAVRSRVPTMYLPGNARYESQKGAIEDIDDEEKGFAKEIGPMGRNDSALSNHTTASQQEIERQITGPVSLQKPEDTLIVRPARPWSEPRSPKRRDDVIHAM